MDQREYVHRLLESYRATPGTCGAVRRPDRLLAAQLHQRGVPLEAVQNALTLAAARRLARPARYVSTRSLRLSGRLEVGGGSQPNVRPLDGDGMRRPVSSAGCVKLPIGNALEVQKETGYEEEYQQEADYEQGREANQNGLRLLY